MKTVLTCIFAALLSGLTASAALAQAPRDQLVVTAAWLQQHAADPNLVLLHVGNKATYDAAYAEAKQITDEDHERVVAVGGLHIIGTERHDSRRIDNQLRGRAGRQGDPGSSRFYL